MNRTRKHALGYVRTRAYSTHTHTHTHTQTDIANTWSTQHSDSPQSCITGFCTDTEQIQEQIPVNDVFEKHSDCSHTPQAKASVHLAFVKFYTLTFGMRENVCHSYETFFLCISCPVQIQWHREFSFLSAPCFLGKGTRRQGLSVAV